jgi:glycosyltransferase involved in cell wall biosynthesis
VHVLQVIHQYPPFSSQGSEVYCAQLARQLRRTDDVRVFHISNPPRGWRRGLRRDTHEGVPTYHCIDGGAYARLATWPNQILRSSFGAALDEFRPDIVHFHNYLSLGDDLITLTRASGAAVVYTLHDYGLICPNALLLRDDGVLCTKDRGDFFQDCCPLLIRTAAAARTTAPWKARLPSLARWQMFGRQQRNPLLRGLFSAALTSATRWRGEPKVNDAAAKREFFLGRTRRIFEEVDLFLAPSRFLLERYVSCGLPADRIVHIRNGMRPFAARQRAPRAGPLRIGYIGSLHPQKGIELLLEAFSRLNGGTRLSDHAVLHVYGSAFGSPISRSYWQRIRERAPANVVFHGAYDNADVGDILARLDVIVVPSLWYENSPLTISEAFMAGVPVITAEAGGMAELVQHGVNGLLFRLGNAADLRARLHEVAERPALLDELRRGIPATPDIEQHAAMVREHYTGLLERTLTRSQP